LVIKLQIVYVLFFYPPFAFLGIFQVNEGEGVGCLKAKPELPTSPNERRKNSVQKATGGVLLFVHFLGQARKGQFWSLVRRN
jgi:hypothetical protein